MLEVGEDKCSIYKENNSFVCNLTITIRINSSILLTTCDRNYN